MPVNEHIAIDLAQAGYADRSRNHIGKSVWVEGVDGEAAEGGPWTLVGVSDPTDSGFVGAAYRDAQGHVVVSMRGTDFSTEADASADLAISHQATNVQYDDTERFLAQLRDNGVSGDVTFVGHSLGGNLAMHATVVGAQYGFGTATCTTFNAPGFSADYAQAHPEFGSMKDRITEFGNTREPVHRVGVYHPGDQVAVADNGNSEAMYHNLGSIKMDGDSVARTTAPDQWMYVTAVTAGIDALVVEGSTTDVLTHYLLNRVYAEDWGEVLQTVFALAVTNPAFATLTLASIVVLLATAIDSFVKDVQAAIAAWLVDVAEAAIRVAKDVFDAAVTAGVWMYETAVNAINQVGKFIHGACDKIGKFFKDLMDGVSRALSGAREHISVNTDRLHAAASRLQAAQRRMMSVDQRLNRMRSLMDPTDWQQYLAVMGMDLGVGYSLRLAGCISYLNLAAQRLEVCEAEVAAAASRF